ncbi:MAG: hypothetical protein AAGJ87_04165 [Pseudomonadota bacterium]
MNDTDSPEIAADFGALWRSAPSPDAAKIIAEVDRQVTFQRRFRLCSNILNIFVLALIAWFDFQGLFIAPWLVTSIVAASLIYQAYRYRRKSARMPDLATMGPHALLKQALRQARKTRRAARAAYAVLPTMSAIGFGIAPHLTRDNVDLNAPPWISDLIVVALLIIIAAGAGLGVVVARMQSRKISELRRRSEKLAASA